MGSIFTSSLLRLDRNNAYRSLSVQSDAEEQEQIRLVESPDLDPKMNSYPAVNDVPGHSSPVNHKKVIRIDRPVINQMVLYAKYDETGQPFNSNGFSECLRRVTDCKFTPLRWLYSLIPILQWLPKYEWKHDLTFDLVAGFTVAVMHIPQGMAYALLGNLPPIIGIYMAFFPVIIYSFMGTSRHVSMGTFAVICLMTGKVAADRMTQYSYANITGGNQTTFDIDAVLSDEYSRGMMIEIATALSFVVGIWQIIMGVFRLGSLSLLLSTELVSGFTTGAAVHVLTSQMKNLLGIPIPRRSGIFKIILTYVDMVKYISSSNVTAVILSAITVTVLLVYNEILKPYVNKKIPFPLPVELFTIIIGTLVSLNWNFSSTYNITIVNSIPTGLPEPKIPPMYMVQDVILDGLIISIVAYAISISMCKIFATKHNYPVDANQELIAEGASNLVGSFFSCAPISASLSRSVIQESVGGKTQLAGLFSCGILVFVLIWIGPFFETLPNCMLSAIIVVALKGMFLQFGDLPKAWAVSGISAMIWVFTFLTTVVLDIEYGLGIGVILSILNLIWNSNHGHFSILGAFADCELYTDVATNNQAKEIPGVKIIKYTGSLNFATVESFVERVEKIVALDQKKVVEKRRAGSYRNGMLISSISHDKMTDRVRNGGSLQNTQSGITMEDSIDWVVLDMSSVSSLDPGAVTLLFRLYSRYCKEGVQILFAACPSPILHVMNTCQFLRDVGLAHFFPSVHDAVTHCSVIIQDQLVIN